jgi:hypothetical protein
MVKLSFGPKLSKGAEEEFGRTTSPSVPLNVNACPTSPDVKVTPPDMVPL